MPPPSAPREFKRRPGALIGLWGLRLFILPHTLVGIGLLGAMLFMPLWQMLGTTSMTPATRVWTTSSNTKTTKTSYHVEYRDPVSGKLKETGIGRAEFDRLSKLLPVKNAEPVQKSSVVAPAARVTAKSLKVGQWHYTDVIDAGSSGWKTVGFIWLFGLFWNAIVSVFAFMIYVQPWRDKRLRRDGDASPGRIIEKRTAKGNKGRTRYLLKYAFSPRGGMSLRRRPSEEETTAEEDVSKDEWEAAAEGDEVWVLHWPGRAKPSALWGVGMVSGFQKT